MLPLKRTEHDSILTASRELLQRLRATEAATNQALRGSHAALAESRALLVRLRAVIRL